MSYQPEFCYGHGILSSSSSSSSSSSVNSIDSKKKQHTYPGCAHPLEAWKHNLTIHGLWPQYTDGTWPSSCSMEKFDVSIMESFGWDTLDAKWPNVKASESDLDEYLQFWDHEWSKHGTCSGLDQYSYFNAALNHFVPTPNIVYEHYHTQIKNNQMKSSISSSKLRGSSSSISNIQSSSFLSKQSLQNAYGGPEQVVLVCSKGNYLSEVRFCLEKDEESNLPLQRISCPDTVLKEESCGDDIYIAVFHEDEYNISPPHFEI